MKSNPRGFNRFNLAIAGINASGQLPLRPLDLGLELVADLQPVLDEIIEPIADRLQVLDRQPGQSRLDFLDAAHGHTIAQCHGRFKLRAEMERHGAAHKHQTARDRSVTVTRDPNRPIRVRGLSGSSEVSVHSSSLNEPPVQAWFDDTGRFIILEYPSQCAQVWDAATGLPVTPIFQSRYAMNEAGYRTVNFPQSPIPNPQFPTLNRRSPLRPLTSDFRPHAELLSGSRLGGTGGWQPLDLGEIVERWNELRGKNPPSANLQDQ